jgi:hypothetical protein
MAPSWKILIIVAVTGVGAPAWPQSAPKPNNGDPSEVVCERIGSIGSRLATKKVCATRAEWAEKRKLDREAVDQAQRSANGPCNATLTHSGAPAC